MRFLSVLSILAVVMSFTSIAEAGCKNTTNFKRTIQPHSTDYNRFFTINGRGLITIIADPIRSNDRLGFYIDTPNGSRICDKGYSGRLTCHFNARNYGAGRYYVRVQNPHGRTVRYRFRCRND